MLNNHIMLTNLEDIVVLNTNGVTFKPHASVRVNRSFLDLKPIQDWIRKGKLHVGECIEYIPKQIQGQICIAHFVHTTFRGGAERATMEIHKALKQYDVRQYLINLHYGEESENRMLSDDAREIFDGVFEERIDNQNVQERVKYYVDAIYPDVIMYSLLRDACFVGLTYPTRPAIIQVCHSELDDMIIASSDCSADVTVCVSEHMKDNLLKKLPIHEEGIRVIHNAIDINRVICGFSMRNVLRIPEKAIVIGVIGNLNNVKRPLLALDIFQKANIPNSYLILAGNPSGLEKELKLAIEKKNLGDRVKILGLVENIKDVYATMDIQIHTSSTEGLPMSLVEGMANALPIIAFNVGGIGEVIDDGKTGHLIKEGDISTFVELLSALGNNKRVIKSMGRAGKDKAKSYFSIERLGKEYMGLINYFVSQNIVPKVSIIMPAYNCDKTVDATLNSIRKQTMRDWECIVVDDGSTDDTAEIVALHSVEDARVKYYYKEHSGIVATLNMGLAKANCDIIARMDTDDIMCPDRLDKQYKYMTEHPDIDILGGQLQFIKDGEIVGRSQYCIEHKDIVIHMATDNPVGHPSVMAKKEAMLKTGGYKGDGRAEDWRLWIELASAGAIFHNLPDDLIYYTTHNKPPEYYAWVSSIKTELQAFYKETFNGRKDS